jgi:hypothetical protein
MFWYFVLKSFLLIFRTEIVLTVLVFPTEFVLTVLAFPTEIVLSILAFRTEIILTILAFRTEIILAVLAFRTEISVTVVAFRTEIILAVVAFRAEISVTVLAFRTEIVPLAGGDGRAPEPPQHGDEDQLRCVAALRKQGRGCATSVTCHPLHNLRYMYPLHNIHGTIFVIYLSVIQHPLYLY